MKDLEKKISPLIRSQFPAFYNEEGENFIAFMEAYYEWMEQTNNSLYHNRRLLEYKDIDKTVDDFIIHFKEKFLNNIQFTTATNKKLLIKKSQDLYRSKGTERSIDLFFRLVYGIKPRVYIPGGDVFKASDGKYVKPIYLEVTREARNIEYIGKEITGAFSGAKAFVEKLVRRRINGKYVDIFYISAVIGNFVTNEVLLVGDGNFEGAPIMTGSFTSLEVVTKATGYKVGDIVDIISTTDGAYGKARVTAVSNATGVVDFQLIDGGFGYTTSANVIISEKVLTLGNVNVSNNDITTPFLRFETITQNLANVTYQPVLQVALASNTGAFTNNEIVFQEASGSNTFLGTVISSNSTTLFIKNANTGTITTALNVKGATSGANAVISDVLVSDDLVQIGDIYTNYYSNGVIAGQGIIVQNFTNSTPYIGVYKVAISNGNIYDSANANYSQFFYAGNTTSANTARLTLKSYANVSATGNVMGVPTTITLNTTDYTSTFVAGEIVLQNTGASGRISQISTDGANAILVVANTVGVFDIGSRIVGVTSNASANVLSFNMTVGVFEINNSFINVGSTYVYGGLSNSSAEVLAVSTGTGAGFSITSLDNQEPISIGTDRISGLNNSGVSYASLSLNATYYGFPKMPSGNLTHGSLLAQLTYFSGNVGTISAIGNINPGADYNVNPFVLVYDERIAPANRKDLYLGINQTTIADFIPGEIVTQSIAQANSKSLNITNVSNTFVVGEMVTQSNSSGQIANGYISALSGTTMTVRNITGSFVNTGYNTADVIIGYSSTAEAQVADVSGIVVTNVAKGIVKSVANSTLTVKPISFNTQFTPGVSTINGESSAASGTLSFISEVEDSAPAGTNALVEADVITANGVVNTLQRLDSGFGYVQNEVVTYRQEGKDAGTARIKLGQQGVGEGYYESTDGFLSFDKKLFDGDYYQEYSYEIISKLPFEKYADIFKQVMHTAGTRVFGAVELMSLATVNTQIVHDGTKLSRLIVTGLSNTENFIVNESVYQSNGTANVAIGKIRAQKEATITLSSSANVFYQVGTTLYQPNSSSNAASGTVAGKVVNAEANTLTLYLSDVKGTFATGNTIQGTTNTVLTVAPYLEVTMTSVQNPRPETASFIVGETVTTPGGFSGTVQYCNIFEAEIVPISGSLTAGTTLTGSESQCSAVVVNTTGVTASIGSYVYQPRIRIDIYDGNGIPFANNEQVFVQRQETNAANQVFQNTAIGTIETANSTALILKDKFGGFNRTATIRGATSNATATILAVGITNSAVGYIVGSNSTSITIVDTIGTFKANSHVYGANVAANVVSIAYQSYTTSNVASAINTILVGNTTGEFTTGYSIVGANSGANGNVTYIERYND